MKPTNNKLNNMLLLTGIIIGILIISTSMVKANPYENEKKQSVSNAKTIELEVAEHLKAEAEILSAINDANKPGIKIFDQLDRLVFESNLTIDMAPQDTLLYTLLLRSDYIITIDNVAYFTINQ